MAERQYTRREWLYLTACMEMANGRKGGAVSMLDFMLVKEAIASTAIEHPEWDMNETKTWEEWVAG